MFFLHFDIDPVAKGRPRFASKGKKVFAYTDKKTRLFEKDIQTIAKMQFKHAPLEGALKVEVNFYIKPPRSVKRKYPTSRRPGDLDNLLKSLFDPLNDICWNDDSQITTITASKVYREESGIELFIYQLH